MKEVVIRFVGYSENHISLPTTPEIRTGKKRFNTIAYSRSESKVDQFSDTNPT